MTDDVTPEAIADDVADLARELEQLRALYDETKARLDNVHLDLAELSKPSRPTHEACGQRLRGLAYLGRHVARAADLTRTAPPMVLKLQEHPEAEMRLESTWLAWEATWRKSAERASWLRDCLDPQLVSLMAPDGPLRLCSAAEHQHALPPDLQRVKSGPCMMLP